MQTETPNNIFDILVGFVVFLSFLTFAFCAATLKNYIDESEIRKEESVSRLFRASPLFLPERIFTDAGRRRIQIAKAALIVLVISVGYLVVRRFAGMI